MHAKAWIQQLYCNSVSLLFGSGIAYTSCITAVPAALIRGRRRILLHSSVCLRQSFCTRMHTAIYQDCAVITSFRSVAEWMTYAWNGMKSICDKELRSISPVLVFNKQLLILMYAWKIKFMHTCLITLLHGRVRKVLLMQCLLYFGHCKHK